MTDANHDPGPDYEKSLAQLARELPEDERTEWVNSLTDQEAYDLQFDWGFWSRSSQREPTDAAPYGGPWTSWLILAGRGFGKTRTGTEWVRQMATGRTPLSAGRYRRFAIIAETAADARDVLVEGPSGILRIHPPDFRPMYEPSKRRLTWPNGAVASLYNATEPDQLRGPEHDAALADELAKWAYARETWDMLQFGLRSGQLPRVCITTTPRPIQVLKEILADPTSIVTRGRTYENADNLAPSFMRQIVRRYAGTRLGRQELEAELLEDVAGALWTRAIFDKSRRRMAEVPQLVRVVVAVDPSGTKGVDIELRDRPDDIGIVVAGLGVDGRGYVLADWTCNLSPEGWAKRAVQAYSTYRANGIVAEINYGGAMVEAVIRAQGKHVPVKVVTASRGKAVRADPVGLLYEQGRISHVAMPYEETAKPDPDNPAGLSALEDEMVMMTRDGYVGERSPNRLDALVWAFTELFNLTDGGGGYDLARAL